MVYVIVSQKKITKILLRRAIWLWLQLTQLSDFACKQQNTLLSPPLRVKLWVFTVVGRGFTVTVTVEVAQFQDEGKSYSILYLAEYHTSLIASLHKIKCSTYMQYILMKQNIYRGLVREVYGSGEIK